MGDPIKAAKVTRRFYGFEALLESLPGFEPLRRARAIADLQLAAGYVWAREGGKGKCPIVRPRPSSDHSYCAYGPPVSIHLARKHRNLATLLHELAHALGTRDKLDHGPAFRKRCIRLYREYGGWDGEVNWDQPLRGRTQ